MARKGKPARLARGRRSRRASSASDLPAAGPDRSGRLGPALLVNSEPPLHTDIEQDGHYPEPGSCESREDLETRPWDPHSRPLDARHLAGHRHHLSGTTSSTSQTLECSQDGDSDCGSDCGSGCVGHSRAVLPAGSALRQWRLDICRWARRGSDKPDVLYRRNGSPGGRKPASPLFELNRPATVDELLAWHTDSELSIGEFMAQHAPLEPFMPYVVGNGHSLPASPGIVPVNDHATQHLPPLASSEYAAHISRMTYLVRSLQAIGAADPGFLSNVRVHLLLDLVMDLEQTFTLPRIDFLRGHAATVRAMGMRSHSAPESRDTSCVVGYADGLWTQQRGPPPVLEKVEHIKDMAYAIPRHPRVKRAATTTTDVTDYTRLTAPAPSSHHTCNAGILGDRLKPDGAFWTGLHESKLASTSAGNAERRMSIDSQPHCVQLQYQQNPAAYVATALSADAKLFPVVRPLSMESFPTLQLGDCRPFSPDAGPDQALALQTDAANMPAPSRGDSAPRTAFQNTLHS